VVVCELATSKIRAIASHKTRVYIDAYSKLGKLLLVNCGLSSVCEIGY